MKTLETPPQIVIMIRIVPREVLRAVNKIKGNGD